jgi:hypothetical protein
MGAVSFIGLVQCCRMYGKWRKYSCCLSAPSTEETKCDALRNIGLLVRSDELVQIQRPRWERYRKTKTAWRDIHGLRVRF